jgi:vanillate/3-O-methylgallate O-demethylase
MEVLERVSGPVPETKFFHMAEFVIDGYRVRGLRHGMAGQPGFELFGPWVDGDGVREALLRGGETLGITPIGAKAYSTSNLESGWMPAPVPAIFHDDPDMDSYRQWLPASEVGSLGGSMDSPDIRDYYVTPYDIGYARNVSFDHDFLGRSSLERLAESPRRNKVTLIWNPDDVSAAFGSLLRRGLGAKYIEMPKARYAWYQADKVLHEGQLVRISNDCGYNANMHAIASLATVDAEYSKPGTELTLAWGEVPSSTKPAVEEHVMCNLRVTVAPAPYESFARSRYRTA